MKDVTIEVKNVVKVYKLYNKPTDRLKESLIKNSCYHKDFYAVNDVSFSVKRGETVGIIGKNGAGKSTMLKMITGVLAPTSGEITLSGHVSALLELGTGFDAERNGIDNIYLNGRINGLSKKEIEDSMDEILEFADIGDFVYQPIKTYSSGMLVRLAFATAINVKPEILIVDEALSVGDVRFQQKCYRKIREFKENGTVLFVSHDTGAISSFCDRVIWLDDGQIYKEGVPGELLKEYLAYMRYEVKAEDSKENDTGETSGEENTQGDLAEQAEETSDNVCRLQFGNKMAQFVDIRLLNEYGQLISCVKPGQAIILEMEVDTKEQIEFPIFGFVIKDRLGNELVVTNTALDGWEVSALEKDREYKFQWRFNFPEFHADEYPIDVALADGTYQSHEQIHFVSDALIIKCVDERLYPEGRGRYILNRAEFVQC
ncbi:ABC transporter ATP-binding protein [Lachnospiraceae bacterium]|nr:ABC transporter ATP-binding protein [Lachnospiraceae bacterium]